MLFWKKRFFCNSGEAKTQHSIDFNGEKQQQGLIEESEVDLNMPKKSGFDVLEWIRTQRALKCVPVMVLTASLRQEDVARSFELGASSYLVKPSNLQALTDMVRNLNAWTKLNHFPPMNEMVAR